MNGQHYYKAGLEILLPPVSEEGAEQLYQEKRQEDETKAEPNDDDERLGAPQPVDVDDEEEERCTQSRRRRAISLATRSTLLSKSTAPREEQAQGAQDVKQGNEETLIGQRARLSDGLDFFNICLEELFVLLGGVMMKKISRDEDLIFNIEAILATMEEFMVNIREADEELNRTMYLNWSGTTPKDRSEYRDLARRMDEMAQSRADAFTVLYDLFSNDDDDESKSG